jgi:hypothetical protein
VDGDEIETSKYPAYLASVVPTTEDRELLRNIFKDNNWIETKKAEDEN